MDIALQQRSIWRINGGLPEIIRRGVNNMTIMTFSAGRRRRARKAARSNVYGREDRHSVTPGQGRLAFVLEASLQAMRPDGRVCGPIRTRP